MTELETRFFDTVDGVIPLDAAQRNTDTTLESLAIDSLEMLELIQRCETEFGFTADGETMLAWRTLGDILQYITNETAT